MGEHYYVLCRPDVVMRVSGSTRRRITHETTPTYWSRPGAGRNAASAAIVQDATGEEVDAHLALAFSHDILDHHFAARRLLIAVREVGEWRREREPEVRAAHRDASVPTTLPEMLAVADAALRGGPWSSWLTVFRTINGPPDVPSDEASAPPVRQRRGER
jgi:hypothetical protein